MDNVTKFPREGGEREGEVGGCVGGGGGEREGEAGGWVGGGGGAQD